MSPPQIQSLLNGGGRYDPVIIPQLEAYVKDQLEQDTYDIDANLALLKLYLLHTDTTKVEIIEGILLKALTAFPATDFALCMYQIPEKQHASLKEVRHLAQQLEMAKFKAFWKENLDMLAQAKGWQKKVRHFIAGVISATYRSIRKEQLMELLNLPAEDLDAIISAHGWTRSKEDKDLITVNTASFESVRVEPKAPSKMSMEQYKDLFLAAASA